MCSMNLTLEMFISISYLVAVDLHVSYFVHLAYIYVILCASIGLGRPAH